MKQRVERSVAVPETLGIKAKNNCNRIVVNYTGRVPGGKCTKCKNVWEGVSCQIDVFGEL